MQPARQSGPEDLAARIRIKRVYRAARVSDGKRILVDRVWPLGVAKDRARLSFCARYHVELAVHGNLVRNLARYAYDGVFTLLYASKNEVENNAIVLRDYLRRWLRREDQR